MAHAEVEERQLLKAMTWWDGFVIALANPGFLIAALGVSIGVLGTTGAFVLWTISVLLGALQNNVYAEMATMFPEKAGGISLYARGVAQVLRLHRPYRHLRLLVRVVERARDQRLRDQDARPGAVVRGHDLSQDLGDFQWSLPVWIGIGCIIGVWLFNIFGIRPAVWLSYVTGECSSSRSRR